jgi:hypothetical protein
MTQRELSAMACPKCGGSLRCCDSRPGPSNTIRRRRACNNTACGNRFTTYELAIDSAPTISPAAMLGLIEQLERNIQDLGGRLAQLKACAVMAVELK